MDFATIAIAIVVISIFGGMFAVKHKSSEQPKQVKVILFGLYFWGLVFLQLLIFGLVYSVINE
ncbi:MAG: hypothetical protein ACXWTT_02405 [Methylobacter sp.]